MRTLSVLVLALAFNICRGEADKAKDDDAVKKEMALLEGEFTMVSGTRNGEDLPEEFLKTAKRITKDGVTTIEMNGELYMKAKITIDTSKKLKTIDYEVTEGGNKGKKVLGIYAIDGDKITFCFAQPDGERPTKLEAKEGSNNVLSTWKRVEKKK